MDLILARHGNTFGAGDPVVWVGARDDLPLVERGREQAARLGEALSRAGVRPAEVLCGPLSRTREHAEIVCRKLGLAGSAAIDERLGEIDYGVWSGLTDLQIRESFGDQELAAWNERSEWPKGAGWAGNERRMEGEVRSLADDLAARHGPGESVLCISSNGRLRYFLKLVPGAFEESVERRSFKVRTGNVCRLRQLPGGVWELLRWDEDPIDGLST